MNAPNLPTAAAAKHDAADVLVHELETATAADLANRAAARWLHELAQRLAESVRDYCAPDLVHELDRLETWDRMTDAVAMPPWSSAETWTAFAELRADAHGYCAEVWHELDTSTHDAETLPRRVLRELAARLVRQVRDDYRTRTDPNYGRPLFG